MRTFMRIAVLLLTGMMMGACVQPGKSAGTKRNGVPPSSQVKVLMREVAPDAGFTGTTAVPWNGQTIALLEPPFVQTRDIALINLVKDASGQLALTAHFTDEAASRIEHATKARVGRQVALTVDGRVIAVATIAGSFGHSMQLLGGEAGSADQARDLYRQISGMVPPASP